MPGSTNNLGGPRIATSQSSNQHTTANDAANAVDAAMTDGGAIGVTNTNAYTVTSDELASDFHFVIGNGATSATANFIISLPSGLERGLTFWRNSLAYQATIRKVTSQTEPVVIIPPGGYALIEYDGSNARLVNYCQPFELTVAASDETSALTTGTGKATWRNYGRKWVTEVYASVNSAQTSGSLLTVDINEAAVSILSTKLTIDNNEESSHEAATPAVISDNSIAHGAKMSIDIDTVGAGSPTGLKVTLRGYYY